VLPYVSTHVSPMPVVTITPSPTNTPEVTNVPDPINTPNNDAPKGDCNTGKDNKEQGSNASISLVNSDNVIVFENSNNNIEFRSQNEID
jgi:hypothetical protein